MSHEEGGSPSTNFLLWNDLTNNPFTVDPVKPNMIPTEEQNTTPTEWKNQESSAVETGDVTVSEPKKERNARHNGSRRKAAGNRQLQELRSIVEGENPKKKKNAVKLEWVSKKEKEAAQTAENRRALEEQEKQRKEWRERRMRIEQLRMEQKREGQARRREPVSDDAPRRRTERRERNDYSRERGGGRYERERETREDRGTDLELLENPKSAIMYALWQSQQAQQAKQQQQQQAKHRGGLLTLNTSVQSDKLASQTPTLRDLKTVTFSASSTFELGEVVLVPRARGGLNYAKVEKKIHAKHCFFDPTSEHPMILWKVVYTSSGRSLFKELPASYIGKLKKPDSEFEEQINQAETVEELDRTIGHSASLKDLMNVLIAPQCSFTTDETVLVPRSAGGFTYGRLTKEIQQTCKVSHDHSLPGWRIVVAESEKGITRKEMLAACIGKICLTAAPIVQAKRPVYASIEQSIHMSREMMMRKESEIIQERKREKRRRRKREFGGIRHRSARREVYDSEDEEEVDDSDESEEGGEPEAAEQLDGEVVLWNAEEKGPDSRSSTPPPTFDEEEEDIPSGHHAQAPHQRVPQQQPVQKEVSSQPSVRTDIVQTSSVEQPDVQPAKPPTGEPSTETATETTTGSPAEPASLQIGGILAVNKEDLLKKLMGKRSHSKKRLVVIDGPNLAKKHGKDTEYSGEGIRIALDYWNRRGHDAIAFLPQHYVRRKPGSGPVTLAEFQPKCTNIPMLLDLVEKGQLILTPPQDYDDTYVIEYARGQNGFIVSNDRFWDYVEKMEKEKGQKAKKEAKKYLQDHLISFTFVRDEFFPNPNFKFPQLE